MPQRHKRYFLKAKESKELLDKASKRLKIDPARISVGKVKLEVVETEYAEIFLSHGKPILIKSEENLFPTLMFREFFDVAPKVIVDMGAVPYVCKGANVMAPGIRRFEGEFGKGDIVLVADEKHGKPVAVGEIIYDMEEAKNTRQGIVVKNLHFVGDNIWSSIKELTMSAGEELI